MLRRPLASQVVASLIIWSAALLAPAFAQTVPLQPPPADFAAGPVKTGHLEAELVAETQGVAPGGLAYVAIRQDILKGWHTYWRNPGDSGEATSAKWTLPSGWSVGDWVWPAPQRLPLGPLMNYGYTGQVLLPVSLNVPASAKPGSSVTLKADVRFLVCADICVPEEAKLKLTVPVVAGTPPTDPKWGAAIDKTIMDAPKASGLDAAVAWAGQGPNRVLKLGVTGDALKGVDLSGAYFFPYDNKALDHAARQQIEKGPGGLTLTLKPQNAAAAEAPSLDGVLSLGGKAYEVSAVPEPIPAEAGGLGAVTPAAVQAEAVAQSTAGQATATPAIPPEGANLGLLGAVAFALIGGLILNLMPCVFPVLSMKAASLAAHAHQEKEARAQGLAFLAGVLATFLALAGSLLALKAGGAAIGWGFQLQSPAVVGALALVMLLVALNMSGVFETTLPGQGAGGSLAARGGLAGAFFTGMLAVVVAAPCTAPFMATALGFALTQSAPAALLVFTALGLGFAAPFVAVTFIPALMRLFPRPGAWMDTLKHLLAFPMYGTAAWLLWVFDVQSHALAPILAASVLVGFSAWLIGQAQRAAKPLIPGIAAGIAAVLAVASMVAGAGHGGFATSETTASADVPAAEAAPGKEAASEPFTPARLADLQAQGKPVFVNFTAAWCVTCQVNERLALGSPEVAKALADVGGVYLKADWTNHDSEIAQLLAEHGRAGVPLYLVYGSGGGTPAVLPQLLTPGAVAQAIRAAGKKA